MPKKINVGLVGYKFMGKAHSHAYLDVAKFFQMDAVPVMRALCGREEAGVKAAAANWGWETYETSWEKLVKRPDIDVVDISAPSYVHRDIALAAAKAGKHVFCEKPLAFNLKEAKEMVAAVRKAGVKHLINFNYRRCPAIGLAKRLISEGQIGQIYHFRGTYLQDWIVDPKFPMNWRLRKSVAGSGAHGDLNAHMIDMARNLVGEITDVCGQTKTFIKERPAEGSSTGLTAVAAEGTEKVTVDDATMFLAKFENGALGTFEATRVAPGHKNYNRFEINGSEGSLAFCFEDMNQIQFYSRKDPAYAQGFRTILATQGDHPYFGAWWPPGHIIGYEHAFIHQVYELMQAIAHDKMPEPNFLDGARCQAVLDSVVASCEKKAWVKVPKVQ